MVELAHLVLYRAARLVGGERAAQHGDKTQNFQNIARHWNAYLWSRPDTGAPLNALDVGHMFVLMKIARTQAGSLNLDDYIDAAGYAGCAAEVAQVLTAARADSAQIKDRN